MICAFVVFQLKKKANKKTIKNFLGVKQVCVMISSLQEYQRQSRVLSPSSSRVYF